MRFIRFMLKDKKPFEMKGITDNKDIKRIHGSIFQGYSVSDEHYCYDDVKILPPVLPNTFIATETDIIAGYVKSSSSFAGSGSLIFSKGISIHCIPRIGFIIDPRSVEKIFGVTMVLDFVVNYPNIDYRSSSTGYTVVGPTIWNSGWESLSFHFLAGTDNFSLRLPENYKETVNSCISYISPMPGDVVAVAFDENIVHSCTPGGYISMVADGIDTLEASIR